MSRWADSTDDDDDYLQEGDHEDYVEHAIGADQVSVCFTEDYSKHGLLIHHTMNVLKRSALIHAFPFLSTMCDALLTLNLAFLRFGFLFVLF